MAERALLAFGRYVKLLRERRGLSLEDAAALTRVYSSPLNKGYVSRVERGLTRVGFDKMIGIARAYDVPVDVFADRLWLDMELDTTGPPDTGGTDLLALVSGGSKATRGGHPWHAYAFLRDASFLAMVAPTASNFASHTEQIAFCMTNVASAAMRLGALKYAIHEMTYAQSLLPIGSRHSAMVLTHLANLHRRLHNLSSARDCSERAIGEASSDGGIGYLGYALAARGVVSAEEGNHLDAIRYFQRAIEAFRQTAQQNECALIYADIAEEYFRSGRTASARRALASSERLARQHGNDHVRALVRILSGEIREHEGRMDDAIRLWRDASEMARLGRDRTLVFKADFLICRRSLLDGNRNLARSLAKKLLRIAPWVLPDIPELRDLKKLLAEHSDLLRRQRPVARAQRDT